MKKYLLVLTSLELGGAERQALNFAEYLVETGRQVTILGLTNPGVVCQICANANIPCVVMTEGNRILEKVLGVINIISFRLLKKEIWVQGISIMFALARYIYRNGFDVCISYCSPANTILGCIKRMSKNTVFVWFQRDAGLCYEPIRYQRRAINSVDFIFANGNSGKEWIKNTHSLEATVIYNGVSLKKPMNTVNEWRQILRVTDSDIVCTMIANLSRAKDHMSLLKAWKRLCANNTNMILVFAGRFDEEYERLYEYAEKNTLLDYVRFLGPIQDVSGLLYASDMCVFGAISEGSPNGIIEAMLAGLPIVATDLPEIREVISRENYEYLFQKDDISSIVKHVTKVSNDADLRNYLGGKNKEKAINCFASNVNFNKIIHLVEGLER